MDVNGMREQAQMSAMLYHDNSGLAKIKHAADQQGALKEVAGQFEAMFLQLVLRQMRSSSDVLADEDSPFSSQQYGVFRDMYDGQLAIELARKQNAGIADMLVKQLSPNMPVTAEMKPIPAKDQAAHTDIALKRLPTFDAANDEMCVVRAESRAAGHIAAGFNGCGSLNVPTQEVASNQQQRKEVVTSTAFSQPLIRKMEL